MRNSRSRARSRSNWAIALLVPSRVGSVTSSSAITSTPSGFTKDCGTGQSPTEGENLRFIVTNIDELDGEAAYDYYTERGQSENFVKDLKNEMFADRLSCSAFMANRFRLLLHTAAYIVMLELRRALADTALANAQMDTLRLKLLKIGACIVVTARRIWVQLSQFDPSRELFETLCRRLAPAPT